VIRGLVSLNKEVRAAIATNIDIKLEHYFTEQSYKHMSAKNSPTDFCRFLGVMVSKVFLNNRIAQQHNNLDLFISLFDIIRDKGILGINPGSGVYSELSGIVFSEPEMFKYSED